MSDAMTFEYLNLDLDWPGLTTVNLERGDDGRLTLARVPRLIEDLGIDALATAAPDPGAPAAAPAGIATTADCDCNLYIADPVGHRVWWFDPCAGTPVALVGLQGPGSWPGQVNTPRGLAIARAYGAARLYIADSGNHRIQVLDRASQQPLAVWGQPDPYAPPAPGAEPGRLNDPCDLAADAAGNLYVVDRGNRRVQKFAPDGRVVPEFWATMASQPTPPQAPLRVAITSTATGELLYLLDRGAQPQVLVFNLAGEAQPPVAWAISGLPDPVALAVSADAVYVGDAGGTIAKFKPNGQLISTLARGGQSLASLTIGCAGELLAGSGGLPVARLRIDTGFTAEGSFLAGPFESRARALAWHRWRVMIEPLASESHIQLFTYSSAGPAGPPSATADNPFADPGWSALPRDECDGLILSQPVRSVLANGPPADPDADKDQSTLETTYFWLGGVLRSDGTTSPAIQQMRIDYAPSSYLRYLPAIYRAGAQRRLFLDLMLAALGSELGQVEQQLADLPAHFDPAAAPADWLPWLASWLDFDLIEEWPTEEARRYLAEAIELYRLRGTVEGLRRYLKIYAGVEARVEEPAAIVALFALDERAALGINTVLAPAYEQGAVLAATATLGQSHLLAVAEIGVPLFADVTNRFYVQIYAAELREPHTRDLIVQAIEREKPAHTDYHLCTIEARMRVGFQATIGIDSIVGGPAPDLRLDATATLGMDTVLANQPRQSHRLGQGAHVGGML